MLHNVSLGGHSCTVFLALSWPILTEVQLCYALCSIRLLQKLQELR